MASIFIIDYRPKGWIFVRIALCFVSGSHKHLRSLKKATSNNATFHPVICIEGQKPTFQLVLFANDGSKITCPG